MESQLREVQFQQAQTEDQLAKSNNEKRINSEMENQIMELQAKVKSVTHLNEMLTIDKTNIEAKRRSENQLIQQEMDFLRG